MMRKTLTLTLLALLAVGAASCAKLQARDNLNKGIRAFRENKYEKAVEYFQQATELDPQLTDAELYLATAYSQQFIPNGRSEQNSKMAEMAITTFEKVLEKDSKNVHAVEGLAYIYQNSDRLGKAREYYLKQTELDPKNPTPFYAVGSVNWLILQRKATLPAMDEQNHLIEEGLQNIDKALELNPDYEDAMAYKNLLFRAKAERVADPEEKKQLETKADEWVTKALDTRKKNASKEKGPGGIVIDK